MITKRDQDLFNFLDEFHIANASQLHKLFFAGTSYRYSRKRLQQLYESGFLKHTRSTISNDYAYYYSKKSSLLQQTHHDLIRAEVYVGISKYYKVLEWHNEVPISNIRPDALAYLEDHGIVFPVFIEIHLNNKFNFDKYKELIKNNDLKAMFGMMPRVAICTDRMLSIPNIGIKFKVIGVDMAGVESLFK